MAGDPRTRAVDIPGMTGPEIQSTQPVAEPVPQVVAPTGGIQLLSQAFNSFFGQAAEGFTAVAGAENYAARKEIVERAKIEREQNKKAATAAGLAGQPEDPEKAKDFYYHTAYSQAAGQQHGYELVSQFMRDVYPKLTPGDDAGVAADGFLKAQYGKGTGNPDYDAAALTVFKSHTSRLMLTHTEDGVKSQIATGLQTLDSVVSAKIRSGDFTAADIPTLQDRYRTLDPAHPEQAPLRLAHALQHGSDGSPGSVQRIDAMLQQPGSGIGGKSYAESFPDEYAKVSAELRKSFSNGNSVKGDLERAELSQRIIRAQTSPTATADDWAKIGQDLEKHFQVYGGFTHDHPLMVSAAKGLQAYAEAQTAMNRLEAAATNPGSVPVDKKDLNAYWEQLYARAGVDPLKNPEQAAWWAARWGEVPTQLKSQMSNMLLNNTDATAQLTAYRFYRSMSDYYNAPAVAKSHIEGDQAKEIFSAIDQERRLQGDAALPSIIQNVNSNLDVFKDAHKVEWKQITGDVKEGDAVKSANNALDHVLTSTGWFSTGSTAAPGTPSPTLDFTTRDQLLQAAKRRVLLRNRNGTTDWKGVIEDTFKDAVKDGHLEVLPGENSQNMIQFKKFPDVDPKTGQKLPVLSPELMNPNTKQPESTLGHYRDDVAEISRGLPVLFDDPAHISVSRNIAVGMGDRQPATQGIYWLQRNGSRMYLMPGQEIETSTQPAPTATGEAAIGGAPPAVTSKTKVPTDPAEAAKFITKLFPDNRGVVVLPDKWGDQTMFWLGYRPHFTGAPPIPPPSSDYQEQQERTRRDIQNRMPVAPNTSGL